jgi:hypothetical protein
MRPEVQTTGDIVPSIYTLAETALPPHLILIMRVIPACVAESKSWKCIPPPPPTTDCNDHSEGEGYLASPQVRHCPHNSLPSQHVQKKLSATCKLLLVLYFSRKVIKQRNISIEAPEINIHFDLYKKGNSTHITVNKTNCVKSLLISNILTQTHKKKMSVSSFS